MIYLEINYTGLNCPQDLNEYHRSLEPWNYSPVPFLEFGRRQFVTVTKLSNGDYYEGQWNTEGKRDGFGYALIESGTALYEGYWVDGLMHGQGRLTNRLGHYSGGFQTNQR